MHAGVGAMQVASKPVCMPCFSARSWASHPCMFVLTSSKKDTSHTVLMFTAYPDLQRCWCQMLALLPAVRRPQAFVSLAERSCSPPLLPAQTAAVSELYLRGYNSYTLSCVSVRTTGGRVDQRQCCQPHCQCTQQIFTLGTFKP